MGRPLLPLLDSDRKANTGFCVFRVTEQTVPGRDFL